MNGRMMWNLISAGVLIFAMNLTPVAGVGPAGRTSSRAAIAQPVLKWSTKGCYSTWCELGWYSSPAVADLDGDGSMEIAASGYSIVLLDGATGTLEARMYSGHDRSQPAASNVGRTWPDVVVADIDDNPGLEIVTAHGGGWVAVYDSQGYFKQGWPKQIPPGNEVRSLAVYDLDNDRVLEILVATTSSLDQWYVYEPDGSLRPGLWPQHNPDSTTNGYSAGCYNQNLAAGDINGDTVAEIIGPNDTHYLDAFHADGSQVLTNAVYGLNLDGTLKFWSQVGVHVDQAADLRGYADCATERRPNFANSAPIITDLNNDGTPEVVVIGNVYNCSLDPYVDLYEIPIVLKGDRTRWQAGGYDWTVLPAPEPGSGPLSEDYNKIENNLPNPVAVDLDGDGRKEILYPSYDGRLHAYWLDKSEHGSWPFAVTQSPSSIRFASEPVVADLDNNGKAEVIFTSWPEVGSGLTGSLYIVDSDGVLIWQTALPVGLGGAAWNGSLAAPTLANIDGDADLEVVLETAYSGVVAYDLPGTSAARILWGTGRGSYQRSGSIVLGKEKVFVPVLRK